MQTFLPYPDFYRSLEVLDPSRLGNQVYREGLTLLRGGWPNHPASKMWRGYEPALAAYIYVGLHVLLDRGRDYMYHLKEVSPYLQRPVVMPPWVGDKNFHLSHRSNLLRKNRQWYGKFGWSVTDDLPYVWPRPN